MSKYTTEVRFICENSAGLINSVGYNDIDKVIRKAVPQIFNFNFPIFDETYRNVLETKILRHYYTREIAYETVALWKFNLMRKLNEIMPYYNLLYKSELYDFNPFYDVDLTTTHEGNREENSDGTDANQGNISTTSDGTRHSEGTDNSTTEKGGSDVTNDVDAVKNTRWDIYSDTPQGALTNVANETYLTNARKIVDDGTGTTRQRTLAYGGTSETEGTTETDDETHDSTIQQINTTLTRKNLLTSADEYLHHVVGKSGGRSYASLLMEFRETFLNIDMQIINDLSELFFNLW